MTIQGKLMAAALAAPAELGELRLGLVPCHARVTSTHAIDRLLGDEPAADPPASPTTIAIWRPEFEVRRRALSPLEAPLFERLARGVTVAELCELIADAVGEDVAVSTAFECLGRWVAEGQLMAA